MFEIDFLPVGDGEKSGDAIAMRFTRPDTGATAVVTIDAGFKDNGVALTEHVERRYGTNVVDLSILTHPDGDHIGGKGEVLRRLHVRQLWLHRLGAHGGASLPAADAVEELIELAIDEGTDVYEVWAGHQAFGGALTVLGPSRTYYDDLVVEQLKQRALAAVPVRKSLREAAVGLFDRIGQTLGLEVPLLEKEVTARNNSAMVTLLRVDGRQMLFTADAGVPALERAWDTAEALGIAETPTFSQIPHHGSRRNTSSAWLDRLLGSTGQAEQRLAFISVVAESDKHPSGRVVNAYKRRGCSVCPTAGNTIYHYNDAPPRPDFGPLTPLGPMIEENDDE
jgi:beta-lactamase superfamily II metal-dependent hydrolase